MSSRRIRIWYIFIIRPLPAEQAWLTMLQIRLLYVHFAATHYPNDEPNNLRYENTNITPKYAA